MKLLIRTLLCLVTLIGTRLETVRAHGLVEDDDPNSEYSLTINNKHEYISVNGGKIVDLKDSRANEVNCPVVS